MPLVLPLLGVVNWGRLLLQLIQCVMVWNLKPTLSDLWVWFMLFFHYKKRHCSFFSWDFEFFAPSLCSRSVFPTLEAPVWCKSLLAKLPETFFTSDPGIFASDLWTTLVLLCRSCVRREKGLCVDRLLLKPCKFSPLIFLLVHICHLVGGFVTCFLSSLFENHLRKIILSSESK